MIVPKNHPRYNSLMYRERVAEGVKQGFTSPIGLVAHGRGEAFDYLLGEQTTPFAKKACEAAVAKILEGNAVLSANGNVAALCPQEYVELSNAVNAPIEINLFYRTQERMQKMQEQFLNAGAKRVLGMQEDAEVPELKSERRKVDSRGIYSNNTILVPLEDGDRTECLKKQGKFVIAIDLNPFSRTAKQADITIVDNIVRVIPLMIEFAKKKPVWKGFDNKWNIKGSMQVMRDNLGKNI